MKINKIQFKKEINKFLSLEIKKMKYFNNKLFLRDLLGKVVFLNIKLNLDNDHIIFEDLYEYLLALNKIIKKIELERHPNLLMNIYRNFCFKNKKD